MVAGAHPGPRAGGPGVAAGGRIWHQLDKRYQRANWGSARCPPNCWIMPALDTHYLIPLRDRLRSRAAASKAFWQLARRISARLRSSNGRSAEKNETLELLADQRGPRPDPRSRPQCCRSCAATATRRRAVTNRPLFKVISDQTLLAIAANCPQDHEQLSEVPGMTAGQVRRHGERPAGGGAARAAGRTPLPAALTAVPTSTTWRGWMRCATGARTRRQDMGVPSDMILPRDLMSSLAEQSPGSWSSWPKLMQNVPWRLEHFGQPDYCDVTCTRR